MGLEGLNFLDQKPWRLELNKLLEQEGTRPYLSLRQFNLEPGCHQSESSRP